MNGLLDPIRKLSPNATLLTQANEISITIPFSDVIDAIRNSMSQEVRNISKIEITDKGIVISIKL